MRTLHKMSSQQVLCTAALAGLAFTSGCGSTKPCNPGTVMITVTFDVVTSAADAIGVEVSINGASPKSTTLAHKPGDLGGSVEVDFPHGSGYPAGKRLDVTVVARKGQAQLGIATLTTGMLPNGCASIAVKFTAATPDGGGGAGGGLVGGAGTAGGRHDDSGVGQAGTDGGDVVDGGATDAAAGSDGHPAVCSEGTTRSCATDGALGNCAKGTEVCNHGNWGACDISPSVSDTCDSGDDSNCNGIAIEGCTCTNAKTQPCGNCNGGTLICANGLWGVCQNAPPGPVTYYRDADGDSFGDSKALDTKVSCTGAPLGYVGNKLDCCDTDPKSFPGVTACSISLNKCGSGDWNCDGVQETRTTNNVYKTCDNLHPVDSWLGASPPCGTSAPYALWQVDQEGPVSCMVVSWAQCCR